MSLETLLEAAKYLEYRTQAKARGEEPHDYPTFANLSVGNANKAAASCPLANQTIRNNSESPEGSSSPINQDNAEDQKEKRRTGGAGTREVHNKLEKNRRAHLKECFETLKKQLPNIDERKISNLSILRGALRYIQIFHKVLNNRSFLIQHKQQSKAGGSDIEDGSKETTTTTTGFGKFLQSSDTSNTSSVLLSTPNSTPPQDKRITSPMCIEKKRAPSGTQSVHSCNLPEDSAAVTFLQTSATSIVSPVSMTPGLAPNVFIGVPKTKPTKSVSVTMTTLKKTNTVASSTQSHFTSQGTSDSVLKVNSNSTTSVLSSESVQILTQHSVLKAISSSSSRSNQVPALTSANVLMKGPLKNFTKSSVIEGSIATVSSVPKLLTLPSSNLKPVLSHSLVCVTPAPLAPPQSVISLTPVSSASKSIIINQATAISNEVTTAAPPVVNHISGKSVPIPAPVPTGTNSVINTRGIVLTSGTTIIPQGNLQPMKHLPHVLHHTMTPRAHILPVGGSQVNNMGRHLVTAGLKPVNQTGQPKAQLSQLSTMGHVMQSPTATASVSHLVSGVTAVSAITPLVTPMSVVSPGGPLNQAQLITQSHQLGKVLAATSPLLKTSGQIPIIQPQFLQPTVGLVAASAQPLVKPVVVVSVGNGTQVAQPVRQQGTINLSISQ
ncbi:flocculation protein FLO11-like [Limulus polyphemus]|uniref:Flocculation protein FLO11-like n=1 Tax=Limulus polyphemus TaxID=6850 RepID=A0ABM1TI30_LIMPO|nr:flocculation protein FLO11-like [Limulus polyphemus]